MAVLIAFPRLLIIFLVASWSAEAGGSRGGPGVASIPQQVLDWRMQAQGPTREGEWPHS